MDEVTVYTALMGRHELLQPQPVAGSSSARWVCFTDDPSLTSDDWELVLIDAAYPADPVRSARRIKILGPEGGFGPGVSLWIDNRVTLTRAPEEFVGDLLDDHDLAAFEHSFHESLLDEFVAVVEGSHDEASRVHEQLFHYARYESDGEAILAARPIWTGLLARRWSPGMDAAMRTWWEHVLRYSRRDQLSLPLALAEHDLAVRRLVGDNRSSAFHEWPRVAPGLGRTDRASIDRLLFAPLEELKYANDRLAVQDDAHRREVERVAGEAERAHGRARRAEARALDLAAELEEAREVAGAQRRAAGRFRRRAEAAESDLRAKHAVEGQLRSSEDRLRATEAQLGAAVADRDRLSARVSEIERSRVWRLVRAVRAGRRG